MSEQTQAREKEQLKELGLGLVVGFVIPVLVIAVLAKFLVASHDTASRSGPTMSEQAIDQRLKPVGQVSVEGAAAPAQPAEAKPAEAATPEERIKPVGEVAVAPAAPAEKPEAAAAPKAAEKPAAAPEKPAAPAPAEKPAAPAEKPATAGGGAKTGPEVYKTVCAACHDSGAAGAPKLGDKAAWGPRLQQGLDKLSENAIKGKGAMPPKGGAAQLTETEIALAVIYISDKAGGAAAAPAPTAKAQEKAPAAAPAAAAAPAGDKGKKTYEQSCAACHATGAANAPKFGDKAAWGPRIATGKPALYNSALKGKGAMPAKGGNAGLADDDVKAAVDYMVSQAK